MYTVYNVYTSNEMKDKNDLLNSEEVKNVL
jgi:hypothetical protein